MIQPVKFNSNVSFQADNNLYKDFKAPAVVQPEAKSVAGTAHKVRAGFLNTIKGFNKATGVGAGVARGVVDGAILTAAVGIVGKNIKTSEGQIAGTIKGALADTAKVAKKAIGFIPSLITKAPVENIKSIAGLPGRFYGYLKGNKATAAVATLFGAAALIFRAYQGKWAANTKNANIDHALNEGHNPIK